MKTKHLKRKLKVILHPKYLAIGVLAISLLTTSLVFATSSGPLPPVKDPVIKVYNKPVAPVQREFTRDQLKALVGASAMIQIKVRSVETKFQTWNLKQFRKEALPVLSAFTAYCRDAKLECKVELKNVDIGIRGATKEALMRILKENWVTIKAKGKDAYSNAKIIEG